jgi:hypothetical protein
MSKLSSIATSLVLGCSFLASSTIASADATTDRARKTANASIDYMMKIYKIVDVPDCNAALGKVNKFATENAKQRDALSAELAAAKTDKAYGDALKVEIEKAQAKLKGMKRPKCAADTNVRAAIRKALPDGM